LPFLDSFAANPSKAKKSKTPLDPIWTKNKAKLIERYLLYFVYITKHGTYIDGSQDHNSHRIQICGAAKLFWRVNPVGYEIFICSTKIGSRFLDWKRERFTTPASRRKNERKKADLCRNTATVIL